MKFMALTRGRSSAEVAEARVERADHPVNSLHKTRFQEAHQEHSSASTRPNGVLPG